ncbi:hypothetical protein [Actinoplanes solisilvae]|uniref:hypothetical protein n=1 Tax=Actinoplanes solisilvae TaxID=2486853 RepID=UPI000FD837EF|nr:hypothetical protein [Actinoplanes solisilvae]
MRTRLATVLLCTALAMTACNNQGPQKLDGAARPDGVSLAPSPSATTAPPAPPTSTSPSASTSTSVRPSKSASSSPKTTPTVLGPSGFGALKLGMTRKQAEATGMITGYETENFTGNCGVAKLRPGGATVYFTPGMGLSSIGAYGRVRTPKGIKLGSTVTALKKAYPTWEDAIGDGQTGYGWADHYRFDVRDGKVTSFSLTAEGQRCIE